MSSDESSKGFGSISSTPHPNKVKKTLSPSFSSSSKSSVNYKTKRTKQHLSASKAKRRKYESSSSTDNIHSSTFQHRNTSSNSKSSPFAANKQKKISFSPIEKCYVIPRKSEVSYLENLSENEECSKTPMLQIIIDRVKETDDQDNELEDNADIRNQADKRNDTLSKTSVTDGNGKLVKSSHSSSTTPEQEQTGSQHFVKRPEHSVKKKGLKKVKKQSSHAKNVGRKILKELSLSRSTIISPRKSNFQTYGEWKRMRKEGSVLKSPTPQTKEEEYSLPIEVKEKKQRIPRKDNKKRSLQMEKHTNHIEKEILSEGDEKEGNEEIRKNSVLNEAPVPQNLSDDFTHFTNHPNITLRRDAFSTGTSEKRRNSYFDNNYSSHVKTSSDKIEPCSSVETRRTSGTSNKFKNRIKIISDVEFEDSTKIYIPRELLYQFKNINIENR